MQVSQAALDLGLDDTVPYQPHSATSKRAASHMVPKAMSKREQVMAFIAACGPAGATDDEAQRILRMNPNTQRPRRVELAAKGRVVDAGRTRKTQYGEEATVWVAAEHKAAQ